MDDLISRQAAIDALLHNQEVYSNNFGTDAIDKYTIAIIDNDVQTIAQLQPAQPERKKGKWKKWWEIKPDGFEGEVHIPHWACAECGTEYMPHLASAVHYCVNCGAQMEVENDE